MSQKSALFSAKCSNRQSRFSLLQRSSLGMKRMRAPGHWSCFQRADAAVPTIFIICASSVDEEVLS